MALTRLFPPTAFLAAALTFTIQPLLAKRMLPMFGGTPAVWNSCLLFFQTALLLGYASVHGFTRNWRTTKAQRIALVAVLALALGSLIFVSGGANESLIGTDSEWPFASVVLFLTLAIGAPFFALTLTSTLLQIWYSGVGRNPYPLYAASNLGSFAGLLGYPLLLEPLLTQSEQMRLWSCGFGIWIALILLCGTISNRVNGTAVEAVAVPKPIAKKRIGRWVFLAALPSSLLVSSTNHLTTDIAPVPLIWVVPLALYLLTFVIAFGYWPAKAQRILGRAVPMLLCFLALAYLTGAAEPMAVVALIHLAAFFGATLLCHGELAADKPDPAQLAAFYLALAVGGVLGSALTGLVAPVLFSALGNVEYPLALILAATVRPASAEAGGWKRRDAIGVIGAIALAETGILFFRAFWPESTNENPGEQLVRRVVVGGATFGIPLIVAFALARRPLRFTLALAGILIVGANAPSPHGTTLRTSRNFFGTLRVTKSNDGRFIRLVHGTTLHGQQKAIQTEGRPEPQTYYHRKGPLGQLFAYLPPEGKRRVGVVGLGAGGAAAYAEAGQRWTFYEIDPAVERIARDERYFRFLSACPAEVDVVLGDARRQLRTAEDSEFDLLVLDAFSSDAVPVHLLTKEALELYFRKLAPDGLLAFHVSNRYLDLASLLARVANANDPESAVKWWYDDAQSLSDEDKADGRTASIWVVIARRPEGVPKRPDGRVDIRWQPLRPTAGPIWTDDFSNLLGAWKKTED